MIESKVKHENKLQDNLTHDKRIFEKIVIVCCADNIVAFILIFVIMYVLNHGYLCMNTLFNWFGRIKYRNNNNRCRSRSSITNTRNKDITIESTDEYFYY